MIRSGLAPDQVGRVFFAAQDDCYDTSLWAKGVQTLAHALEPEPENIVLIGHRKDNSSAYLNAFPAWAWVAGLQLANAHASDIRTALFAFVLQYAANKVATASRFHHTLLSNGVEAWLQTWTQTEAALRLAREWQHLEQYRRAWAVSPFPVNFITTDALVQVQDQGVEKILLVRRKNPPGEGLLALPGGFLDSGQTLWQSMLRELVEETGLCLVPQAAHAALRRQAVFDYPGRSNKGRVITHTYHLHLGAGPAPLLCAGDDAAQAHWYPVKTVLQWRRALHDDHAYIIQQFLR